MKEITISHFTRPGQILCYDTFWLGKIVRENKIDLVIPILRQPNGFILMLYQWRRRFYSNWLVENYSFEGKKT